jgi:hypothetical protein
VVALTALNDHRRLSLLLSEGFDAFVGRSFDTWQLDLSAHIAKTRVWLTGIGYGVDAAYFV